MGRKFIVEEVEEKKGCLGTVGSVLLALIIIALVAIKDDDGGKAKDESNKGLPKKESVAPAKTNSSISMESKLDEVEPSAQSDEVETDVPEQGEEEDQVIEENESSIDMQSMIMQEQI